MACLYCLGLINSYQLLSHFYIKSHMVKIRRSRAKSLSVNGRMDEAWTLEMIRTEDPITLSSYFIEQKIPFEPSDVHHAINLCFIS